MKAAMRDSYIEVVFYNGINENYPEWFQGELYNNIFQDENRYTFWMPRCERDPGYYEKQLVEDYSVFLKKPNGEIHVCDYDVYADLYHEFMYNGFNNWGLSAMKSDVIDYVECFPGMPSTGYPDWFMEYFTECINFPEGEETIFLNRSNENVKLHVYEKGTEWSVTTHCVFLMNKFGEIRAMDYDKFIKYYDPSPEF